VLARLKKKSPANQIFFEKNPLRAKTQNFLAKKIPCGPKTRFFCQKKIPCGELNFNQNFISQKKNSAIEIVENPARIQKF
jgi:hypothetical protein